MGVNRIYRILKALTVAAAISLAAPFTAAAQNPSSSLEFPQSVWEFGNIKEADGPVSHTFEFINKSDKAIVIERVSSSCGCTTPEYSKEPVLPGGRGRIKVTYNPDMRPGHFSKDVYIITNNGKSADKITVKGDVEARPRTVEQDYPYLFAEKIRLASLSANFRYVPQGTTSVQAVKYANISSRPVKLSFEISPQDDAVTVDAPSEICAGCRGEFRIKIKIPKGDIYGKLNYKVFPVIDGVRQKLSVSVSAIVTEDFSNVQRGKEPAATVTPTFHNFGKVKKGNSPAHTFTLENTGASPLIVRSVIPQEGITTDLKEGTQVTPGRSVKVKCTLDTKSAVPGVYTKIVTIIFNDPARPMRELRLAATVE